MKYKKILVILLMITMVFSGCTKKNNAGNATPTGTALTPTGTVATPTGTAATPTGTAATPTGTGTTDVVTTASIVNTKEAFIKAISTNGTWIIATLNDLDIGQDIVLEGEFKNGKKDDAGNDIIQRKIALYSQDADRNITARYTLTAPKLTIKSPMASIQHGTFKGDLYVDVDNFKLIDTKVDGNIYFTTQAHKDTFTMDETSSVTGTQGLRK